MVASALEQLAQEIRENQHEVVEVTQAGSYDRNSHNALVDESVPTGEYTLTLRYRRKDS